MSFFDSTGGLYGRDMSGPMSNTRTLTSENRFQQMGLNPIHTNEQAINQQRINDAHRQQFMNQMQRPAPGPVMPGRPTPGVQLPGMGNMMQPQPRMNDQMMFNNSMNARGLNQFTNVGNRSMTPFNTQQPTGGIGYPAAARVQAGPRGPSTMYPNRINPMPRRF